jgi:hypothetical protein
VRTTMVRMVLAGFAVMALAGCANETCSCSLSSTQTTVAPSNATQFVHAVYFDMKPDTPESLINEMVNDAYQVLGKIPSVRMIKSGRRDERMQRDLNDKTFTVGLVIFFDDKAGHDLYNDHPLHKEYAAKYGPHADKVRVFDFTAPAR